MQTVSKVEIMKLITAALSLGLIVGCSHSVTKRVVAGSEKNEKSFKNNNTAFIAQSSEDYKRLGLSENSVQEWEDGMRTSGREGTYEWWYFDGEFENGMTVVAFTTLGVYNFGDKAFKIVKDSDNLDASFWREMEYEYILNVYLYALKNGELSCRSASSGGNIVDFGSNISTASMISKSDSFAEVFIKNFPGMMKVQTKSILSLTAMQYVADRALDRLEKRSLSKLALEFPGKLLYFGVSGSIKSIAVNRYLKNMFVPWLSKAIFGQKIGSKDSVLMAFLVPLDKGVIGQLNLKDQVEWSGPLLFNLGEVIMASMAYKQASEEDLKSLPEETQQFLKLSNIAFEQALKEGDLTLDDISVESDPNDPQNLKFSISNQEKLNKLRKKFAQDISKSKVN